MAAAADAATGETGRLSVLRARLATPLPDDKPWGWLGPLLVTAFGGFLRFNRLQIPRAIVFDETYYAKDAWSILLHRDWRAGAVLMGVLAGWGPWFPLVTRTKFYYYALEFEPFLILSIVLCLGLIFGPATATVRRRAIGAGIVGAYLLCVLLMFWYFYPILAASIISYADWWSHIWYRVGSGWV